jgi:lipopolysaccharide export system permease protein
MTALQWYIFRQVAAPLLAILSGLALVAILTQGLNQLDIIVDQRQSALAFAWITLLSMPLLLSLIMPLAVFFAVMYTVNRMHTENEVAVSFAAGASPWQIAVPVLRIATLAALAHLAVNVLIQPASYREMRETVHALRSDFAAALVREGEFTTPADGLTVYARSVGAGGIMSDVFINDSRNAEKPTTYTAESGLVVSAEGVPAVVLRSGQIQQPRADGGVNLLDFDQYTLEFAEFAQPADEYVLKSSDRFLSGLFLTDPTYFHDQRNADEFLAEGHNRIASILLNPALALVALAGLLGGDFSRRGYGSRIAVASLAALATRVAAIGIQAACEDDPPLNILQYMFPIIAGGTALYVMGGVRLPFSIKRGAGLRSAAAVGARSL